MPVTPPTSPTPTHWALGPQRRLPLDRPRLIAILNATPDSFHADSRIDAGRAREQAARLVEQGAAMLDVGGESTRPGADRVEPRDQITRAIPVIEAVRASAAPAGHVPISIDTTRAEVARAALDAGADAINDVSAGTEDPELLPLAASRGCGLVLMHRVSPPDRDRFSDQYDREPVSEDIVEHVKRGLAARLEAGRRAGVRDEAIVLDPGLGFGKSVEQNLELIRRTPELAALGLPLLSAASRKSFIGRVSIDRDSSPSERLSGSIAVTLAHAWLGVRLFRVHDPGPHLEALRMLEALGLLSQRREPEGSDASPTE